MEWFEELEFDENPFSTDPRETDKRLVEMEELIDEMNYRIEAGSMLVIEGQAGSGKTSLLMHAAKKFGGKKNVAYVDCKVLNKKLNITRILQERYGFMGRVLNKKPKDMIVLLDNVEGLSEKNTERIKYYFDQNYIKSIIFTTTNYSKAKFSESLRDRIGKRTLKIPQINEYSGVEIIRNRIGESELFNDELIEKIFKISGNSPKKMLENCEKVAKTAIKKSRNRAQMADLKVLAGSEARK